LLTYFWLVFAAVTSLRCQFLAITYTKVVCYLHKPGSRKWRS